MGADDQEGGPFGRERREYFPEVFVQDSYFPLALGCVTLEGTARMGAWLRG
jgi:hypothetical protein